MEIDLETINDRECMQHALIGLITNLTTSSTDRHTRYFFKTALDGWSSWLNSTRFEDNSERIAYAERAIEIINMNATAEAERLLATCREIIRDSKQKACVSGAVAYAEQLAADARLLNQINRDHEYRAVLHKLIDFNLENNLSLLDTQAGVYMWQLKIEIVRELLNSIETKDESETHLWRTGSLLFDIQEFLKSNLRGAVSGVVGAQAHFDFARSLYYSTPRWRLNEERGNALSNALEATQESLNILVKHEEYANATSPLWRDSQVHATFLALFIRVLKLKGHILFEQKQNDAAAGVWRLALKRYKPYEPMLTTTNYLPEISLPSDAMKEIETFFQATGENIFD